MNDQHDDRFDDELMARAARLRKAVAPSRDLWPAIAAKIETRPQRDVAWGRMFAQAAAVVLLVGASSGVTYLAMRGGEQQLVQVAAEPPALVIGHASASFGSQYTLGPDFLDARRVLRDNLETELQRLSPESREVVMQNIESIRNAIDDISQALSREPDNVLLQELLISSYRDELSLMQQVDGITAGVMYREDM